MASGQRDAGWLNAAHVSVRPAKDEELPAHNVRWAQNQGSCHVDKCAGQCLGCSLQRASRRAAPVLQSPAARHKASAVRARLP